jgi:tetratricopeptide (TPR) repeat protein
MRKLTLIRATALAVTLFFLHTHAEAQEPRRQTFRAINYEVHATLLPAEQMLEAKATVEFEAQEVSRLVDVELHGNLKVSAVSDAKGKPFLFERDPNAWLRLRVTLPEALPVGQKVTLTFAYAGPLANEENSPVNGVTLASINADVSYLLLPARWFPLTGYPANRFTGVFHITVPQGTAVVGTGTFAGETPAPPSPPAPKGQQPAQPSPARMVNTFRVEQPETAGTFVAGNFRVVPVSEAGFTIPVYTPADYAESAALYGQAVGNAISYFSDQFGALPRRSLSIAQIPDGTLQSFSAPGLLLISRRFWRPEPDRRFLARLAASQWWGAGVVPASPNDALIADGLARYCEGLFVLNESGEEGFNRALEDFAVGALMFEEEAPIAQAGRLPPYSSEYRSVVMNKGALVFNMLRAQLGPEAFTRLLRDFYARYSGKFARIADFQELAQAAANALPEMPGRPKPNIGAFFSSWVNSTGLPEFKVSFVTYRVTKGFRIVGKIMQNLESFRMPVEIRVLTDGNPEMKTLELVGRETDFTIETFGRPKANGLILDPNNHLLKSSPRLRLRAAIARGEELAADGRFYDAIQEYQRALDLQRNSALASFRMGEAFFYQKNYQAAANSFRDALEGEMDTTHKWIEVWSHIYIGKIFDLSGQRERAVNEYSKAQELNDDTGGALKEIERLLKEPYRENPRGGV